jgi:hypothetical protein
MMSAFDTLKGFMPAVRDVSGGVGHTSPPVTGGALPTWPGLGPLQKTDGHDWTPKS